MFSAGTYYLRDCCAQISGLYWYFWLCVCLRLSASMSAAVSMGTYSAWEKYCYIASGLRRARRLAAHGGEGRGHIVSPCAQLVDIKAVLIKLCQKTTVSSCLRQCKSLS